MRQNTILMREVDSSLPGLMGIEMFLVFAITGVAFYNVVFSHILTSITIGVLVAIAHLHLCTTYTKISTWVMMAVWAVLTPIFLNGFWFDTLSILIITVVVIAARYGSGHMHREKYDRGYYTHPLND